MDVLLLNAEKLWWILAFSISWWALGSACFIWTLRMRSENRRLIKEAQRCNEDLAEAIELFNSGQHESAQEVLQRWQDREFWA